ncbi:hypothetical protein Btru_010088 [Bulinus truncatus]|nr:hypothetical protein Btru_010088 [Bulinus truncatus]
MSNQPQRVRRNGSPSTTKQGPIKAVKVFSLKQGNNAHLASSPSPKDNNKLWSRKSPDAHSPERLSPAGITISQVSVHSQSQSPNHLNSNASKDKGKNHWHSPVSGKSRASSADTVVPSYLTGQWPKDINSYHHYQVEGVFMCDKSTQTIYDYEDKPEKRKKTHKRSASLGQGDQLKLHYIKQHLQKSKEGSRHMDVKQRTSPIPGKHSALSFTAPPALCTQLTKAVFTHSGPLTRPNMNRFQRNSVEGLNTEIERLVSGVKSVSLPSSDVDDKVFREVPDGRRAPVPEINRLSCTRSVDTQTPSGQLDTTLTTSYPLLSSQPETVSPATPSRPRSVESCTILRSTSNSTDSKSSKENSPEPSSYISSPKLETSCPFVREPPDGCEKIVVEESRRPPIKEPMLFSPVKPNQFVFKQSQGSAFCPLIKSYLVD